MCMHRVPSNPRNAHSRNRDVAHKDRARRILRRREQNGGGAHIHVEEIPAGSVPVLLGRQADVDTPDETIEESSEVAEVPEPEMFGCPMTDSRGQLVLHVDRDRYLDVAKQLADEGYAMCVDLTAVDYRNTWSEPFHRA